jgi:hypothetical protein
LEITLLRYAAAPLGGWSEAIILSEKSGEPATFKRTMRGITKITRSIRVNADFAR